MPRQQIILTFFTIAVLFIDVGFSQITIHERQFLLHDSPEYMTINMGGLLDGENTYTESNRLLGGIGFEPMISIRISNVGTETIQSPRLVINDERRWFDFNTLSTEFLSGVHNNKEKALSIWKLMRDNRFHYRTPIGGCNASDPVKALGIYGYITCGYASIMMTSIASRLGYKGRVWHLRYQPQPERGHAVAEIDFGDGNVILDVDAQVFFLDYDNQTLIGNDEVVADNFLVDRTHFFGKSRSLDLDMGVMFNRNNTSSAAGNCLGHSLDISLRPGESIIYDWAEANLLHHLTPPVPNPIPWHIANSRLVYQPLFETANLDDLVDAYENISVTNNARQSPIIHAESLNELSYFEVKIESPFVILDGNIKIHGFQATPQDTLTLQFSYDRIHWEDLWNSSSVGLFVDSVNLAGPLMPESLPISHSPEKDSLSFFYPTQLFITFPSASDSFFNHPNSLASPVTGKYYYYLRFIFSPTGSVTACGIDSLKIATIIQTSRRFMPRLRLNDNILEYSDANSGSRNIEIEIVWQESTENTPPETVVSPVFPADGGEPEHTQFTFAWNVPRDPDGDEIVDYEFQLSDRQDMRFPLSTNFEMYLSAFGDPVKPEFNIPWPGLLNDGATYYWRVRAKDKNGAWGRWSPVWSFIPHGVMMPLNGEIVENGNELYLQWQPNPDGYVAAYFEVHGSNEPNGFLADSSTIIGVSYQSEFNITGNIYDYYRVVAVDSRNQTSGPSRLIYFDRSVPSNPESPVEHPVSFELFQNYPNPFNPTTTIRYDSPRTVDVTLKIYNILGQEVFTLVNEQQSAGKKSVVWNGWDQFGEAVGSGVYIYRIQLGDYVQSRKMLLIR